jgi:hypothetical protein
VARVLEDRNGISPPEDARQGLLSLCRPTHLLISSVGGMRRTNGHSLSEALAATRGRLTSAAR